MGTHSAFFVPAKYGIMPEILHTSVLSRGNGLLEGTSFVSQILGTSFGGWLYTSVKSRDRFRRQLHPGHEWLIGAVCWAGGRRRVLFTVGERIPAAAPQKTADAESACADGGQLSRAGAFAVAGVWRQSASRFSRS